MENIPLPSKVEITPGDEKNTATVSIQPCHPGFGTTIGNALRRVLLSSLPGGAVTAFKIKGVSHEFSAIDNVLEDVVEISLNLKQLRLRVNSTEPVRLHLHAKGEKKVTAKDIEPNADVDVINTDLLIATLTSKTAEIDMEIVVSQGRGYVPSETREKENTETDMIVIDSIFTPIRNVGIRVENIRVGQMTNYENLILEIETDGSISPEEAVAQSTQVLLSHFNFIADNTKLGEVKVKKVKAEKSEDDEAEVEEKKEKKAKKESKKKEDK
ncbi:MAG: DNA-directed RNA polymerase subunit alpha [Candidatus Buchananbacteria bacterium]|nr:DNA-directed RNA polymerase subunit alpha [Candidatus Buchananbacteria bacterium]